MLAGESMKRILDTIADPKKMYVDERVSFYFLRRRLAERMVKYPEQLDQIITSLHQLIHEYEESKSN